MLLHEQESQPAGFAGGGFVFAPIIVYLYGMLRSEEATPATSKEGRKAQQKEGRSKAAVSLFNFPSNWPIHTSRK